MKSPASVEHDDRVRLFCALTLPDCVLDGVVEWQEHLEGGRFRLVPRDNLHLTLAFLGHRSAEDVEPVRASLEAAAGEAETIVLHAEHYRETSSVGMVVFEDEGDAAARLAGDLHQRLRRLGVYEPEQRPWLPHLTVARFRQRPRLSPRMPELGAVSPSGAAVYHSLLRPTGAQYAVLHAVGLGG